MFAPLNCDFIPYRTGHVISYRRFDLRSFILVKWAQQDLENGSLVQCLTILLYMAAKTLSTDRFWFHYTDFGDENAPM